MPTETERRTSGEVGLAELVGGLASDVSLLIKQEIELAKTEMASAARTAAMMSGIIIAGIVVVLFGLFFLFFSAVFGLGVVLPTWAASMIIGGGLFVIGLFFVLSALTRLGNIDPLPRTSKTIKESVEWLKRKRA
ncbi:MAG: phage holin family protein [Chloroflexi bacterium]|nr:phage holin family protein [Chloroflexota bacterium]